MLTCFVPLHFQNNAPKADHPTSPPKPAQPQASQQKVPAAGKKSAKAPSAAAKQQDNAKAKANTKAKSTVAKAVAKKPAADGTDTTVKSLAEDLKTDAGAASDESWEKDFDLGDP